MRRRKTDRRAHPGLIAKLHEMEQAGISFREMARVCGLSPGTFSGTAGGHKNLSVESGLALVRNYGADWRFDDSLMLAWINNPDPMALPSTRVGHARLALPSAHGEFPPALSTIEDGGSGELTLLPRGFPTVVETYRLGYSRRVGSLGRRVLDMDEHGTYSRVLVEVDTQAPTILRGDRLVFMQEAWPVGSGNGMVLLEIDERIVLARAVPNGVSRWTFIPLIPEGYPVTFALPDERYLGALIEQVRRNVMLPVAASTGRS